MGQVKNPAPMGSFDAGVVNALAGETSDFNYASARSCPKAAPLPVIHAPNERDGFGSELLPFAAVPISTAGVLSPSVGRAIVRLPVIRMNHNVRA